MLGWLGTGTLIVTLLYGGVMSRSTKRLELQHGKAAIESVRFTPNGKSLVSASFDGTLVMWNSVSARRIWTLDLDDASKTKASRTISEISFMDVSPDVGTIAVSYSRGRVVGNRLQGRDEYRIGLVDSATGRERRILEGHADIIGRIAFSPNGESVLSEGGDRTARLWNIHTGKEVLTITLKEKGAAVAFSPNGKQFAIATQPIHGLPPQPIVGLYDAQTGKLLREFTRRTNVVTSLAFSFDGQILAVAGGDASGAQIDLWDMTGQEPKATFPNPRKEINSIAFSKDGRLLAAGGYGNGQGFVELRDVKANGEPQTFRFQSAVTTLDFSPDGKRLAVGTDKGQILLLSLWTHR